MNIECFFPSVRRSTACDVAGACGGLRGLAVVVCGELRHISA